MRRTFGLLLALALVACFGLAQARAGGLDPLLKPQVLKILAGLGLISASTGTNATALGPSSSTDNAIVRFDGTTGKLVQNSAVTIADTTGQITWGTGGGAATHVSGPTDQPLLVAGGAARDLQLQSGSGGSTFVDLISGNTQLRVDGSNGRTIVRSTSQVVWGSSTVTSPDTGLARSAAGIVKVTDGSTGDGRLSVHAGSVGSPSIHFDDDPNTGFYNPFGDGFAVSCGGSLVAQFSTGGWSANGLTFGGAKRDVAARTGDVTLSATSGSQLQTNEGASGAINLTLPTAATGLTYEAVVQANQYLRFTAATGDTIRDGATASATAGYIRSTTVGSTIRLVAINATEWIVMSKTGTWTIDS